MSWAKIDDLLPHHNKLVEAGASGPVLFGWYVAAICYAQRQRTDGRISRHALGLLMPGAGRPSARVLAQLVEHRLWDQDGDGWVIHDFLEWNASAKDRRAQATRAAGVRWDAYRTAVSTARSNANSNPPADASPLRSSPKPKPLLSEGGPEGLSAKRDGEGPEAMAAIVARAQVLRVAKGYEKP